MLGSDHPQTNGIAVALIGIIGIFSKLFAEIWSIRSLVYGGTSMLKWEYCILSGIETSLKRRLSVTLTYSNSAKGNQNLEIELDRDRSEEMFTTGYLGELGREGWEVVAFHRASANFEAVLKRPMELNQSPLNITSQMN